MHQSTSQSVCVHRDSMGQYGSLALNLRSILNKWYVVMNNAQTKRDTPDEPNLDGSLHSF